MPKFETANLMIDLDSLRALEKVAVLQSFTAAARALGSPKSNVSRLIATSATRLITWAAQAASHQDC